MAIFRPYDTPNAGFVRLLRSMWIRRWLLRTEQPSARTARGERVVAHWLGHKDWREIRKRDACERSEQVVQEAESEAAIRQ